ncbi:MAG: hypothetical protein M3Z92_07075, partial [Bacteroidota bacterium]|nr:hypothetical protein [Bacteroidota bacterium]
MIKGYITLLFLYFFHVHAYSQKRNNVWTFGDATGLNFNTNPVSPIASRSRGFGAVPPYYLSSICTKNGDLLFYTDGFMVWNGTNTLLTKYNKWWPWTTNVIPLITPYIANDSLYYIFGIDAEDSDGTNPFMLQYFTTNRYLPTDTGEIVYPTPANKFFYTTLLSNTSHVIAGTAHCNQVDTWITTHSPGGLYSFLITALGVASIPVITPVPASVMPLKKLDAGFGNIKFSANGERLVIPENDVNEIVVYDFDNNNGKFSNPKIISIPVDQILEDIEISADAGKLYFSSYEVTDPDVFAEVHYIYQMDLNAGSSAAIEKTIYKINAGDRVSCFRTCYKLRRNMQLGPDGKIYVTRRRGFDQPFDQTLGVINDPN